MTSITTGTHRANAMVKYAMPSILSREPSQWRPDLVRRNSAGPSPVREEKDRDGAGLPEIHVTGGGI